MLRYNKMVCKTTLKIETSNGGMREKDCLIIKKDEPLLQLCFSDGADVFWFKIVSGTSNATMMLHEIFREYFVGGRLENMRYRDGKI